MGSYLHLYWVRAKPLVETGILIKELIVFNVTQLAFYVIKLEVLAVLSATAA